jgi:tetratricopeptide (TPR) repeat protein
VRITAQLIATSTDGHLWGNDFDAEMTDGLYQFNRGALREALAFGREAVRIDPQLAAGHELVGMALVQAADFHAKTYAEILPEARAALERALEIEPERGVSLYWLGETYLFGEQSMRRGFEFDPRYGFLFSAQGKYDEAIRAVDRALLSDPANPSVIEDSARVYEFARRYDDAVCVLVSAHQFIAGRAAG